MGMTLDVAVATYGREGLSRVGKMLLPPQEGVRYVVSWQEHGNALVPDVILARTDVEVWRLEKKGLSNNRNNAISHCGSDIVLIADDDLIYRPDSFSSVIRAFEINPDMDLATFRVNFQRLKSYPQDGTALGLPLPKGYFVTSMEIAFRRKSMTGIEFNPLLGLGAPEMLCGEEEIFLLRAIKSGKDCRHIGVTICDHPQLTTGGRISPGVLMGQGCVIRRYYGVSAFPRLVLKAWRVCRASSVSFPIALWYLVKGTGKKI